MARCKYALNNYENNVDFIPDDVAGEFDIPVIKPEQYTGETDWVSFTNAASTRNKEKYSVHFFIYDYLFMRLWTHKMKYLDMLQQFNAVMSPDFSLYTDWPKMVQMFNHYRKHLLGAWMQSNGIKVYPTIAWSDRKSYAWCFDGEPHGGTVCVSSVGTQKSKESSRLFMDGYERMMSELSPTTVLFYGKVPTECTGNIVKIQPFYAKLGGGKGDET